MLLRVELRLGRVIDLFFVINQVEPFHFHKYSHVLLSVILKLNLKE